MAYVNVPNDLSKVKNKLAFNLTKRQLVCFGIAAAVGIPTYIFTRAGIGNMGAMLLMIGLMLPCFLFAMYERDGLPFEKVLRNIIRSKLLWPGIRPYKTENLYQWIVDNGKLTVKDTKLSTFNSKLSINRREETQIDTSKKAKAPARPGKAARR